MTDNQMNPYAKGEIKIFVDDLAIGGRDDWESIANQEAMQKEVGVEGFQLWDEVEREIYMGAWNLKEKMEEIYPNADVTIVEHGSFNDYQYAQSQGENLLGAVYMGHGESKGKIPEYDMFEEGRERHREYDMYEEGKKRHREITQRRIERASGELDLTFQTSFRGGTDKQWNVKAKDYMSVEGSQGNASFTREADDLVGKLEENKLEYNQQLDEEFAKAAADIAGEEYKYGGKSVTTGLDCSGSFIHAFKKMGIDVSSNINANDIYSRYTRPLESGEKAGAGAPIFYKQSTSNWTHLNIMTSEADMIHGSSRKGKFLKRSTSMPVYEKGQKKEVRKIMWDKVLGDVR